MDWTVKCKKQYYTYILANKYNTVLYVGMTNDIVRRIGEHKNCLNESFSKKYKVNKLVYYEVFDSAREAIAREKQIKGYSRIKKENLIEKENHRWDELYNSLLGIKGDSSAEAASE